MTLNINPDSSGKVHDWGQAARDMTPTEQRLHAEQEANIQANEAAERSFDEGRVRQEAGHLQQELDDDDRERE